MLKMNIICIIIKYNRIDSILMENYAILGLEYLVRRRCTGEKKNEKSEKCIGKMQITVEAGKCDN